MRVARLLGIAIVVGTSIGLTLALGGFGNLLGIVPAPLHHDWDAYWDAAIRLRMGQPLYPPGVDQSLETTFRYAPWFAWFWVPMTFLPHDLVEALWLGTSCLAAGACVWPLIRSSDLALRLLALVFTPYLAQAAAQGNVQPLLLVPLVYGVDRRSGPVWIGLAASLKAFPILYVVSYAVRRQWTRCATAILVAAVLWAPVASGALGSYPAEVIPAASLVRIAPVVWLATAAAAFIAAVRWADSDAGWFSSSLLVVLATPRLLAYDMTFLLVTGRRLVRRDSDAGG